MEEKIKKLKDLAVAHECALNFDYCPDPSEAENIATNYFNHDLEDLKRILNEYTGWSPSNITEKTFSIIEEL